MLLGGKALKQAFQSNVWQAFKGADRISAPEVIKAIGPNSIDVTLHPKMLTIGPKVPTIDQIASGEEVSVPTPAIDVRDPDSMVVKEHEMNEGSAILLPGEFYIGAVQERFDCDSTLDIHTGRPGYGGTSRAATFVQHYDGRSTCGRLGIQSHMTAGFGDYGFSGAFTLEIQVAVPIRVYAGMRIGQVFFTECHGPETYHGAYRGTHHHDGPVAPAIGPERF